MVRCYVWGPDTIPNDSRMSLYYAVNLGAVHRMVPIFLTSDTSYSIGKPINVKCGEGKVWVDIETNKTPKGRYFQDMPEFFDRVLVPHYLWDGGTPIDILHYHADIPSSRRRFPQFLPEGGEFAVHTTTPLCTGNDNPKPSPGVQTNL